MARKCAGGEFLAYMHITGIQLQPELQHFKMSQKPLAPPSHILEVPFQSASVLVSPRLLELLAIPYAIRSWRRHAMQYYCAPSENLRLFPRSPLSKIQSQQTRNYRSGEK